MTTAGDVGIGFGALIATFVLAMMMGGFSFFEPWVLWTAVSLFVAGLSRAKDPEEKFWLRVISIDSSWLLLGVFCFRGPWWWAILLIAGTTVPTIAGLLLRRTLARYDNRSTV